MCGVAGGLGPGRPEVLRALRHRGPDAEGLVEVGAWWLAHARLAVLDLDPRSDQPFLRGDLALSYNGEVWNYCAVREELRALGEEFATEGDTEVVAAALARWGWRGALPRLEGQFALAWVGPDGVLRLARDRFGEVPLHLTLAPPLRFASELKALLALGAPWGSLADVGPGEVVEVEPGGRPRKHRWYAPPLGEAALGPEEASARVRELLRAGVEERLVSDVPVCALLSGGLDSSAICALLAELGQEFVAYAAVLDPRSPDLRAAREVAERLGVELREVPVAAPSAADLAVVVATVELPHKAQVEIGWACLALARRAREDGFRVVLSGEGSDELWASYADSWAGVAREGWGPYRRRLILGQARKNFPRTNKAFMAHGVEARLPFLSRPLVELALSLPEDAVRVKTGPRDRKRVLQEALRGALPDTVVDRPRLAFQDGLGLKRVCSATVSDPKRFYKEEHDRIFGPRL